MPDRRKLVTLAKLPNSIHHLIMNQIERVVPRQYGRVTTRPDPCHGNPQVERSLYCYEGALVQWAVGQKGLRPARELTRAPLTTTAWPEPECQNHLCKRSEEHTSELQSRGHLVCRLLL